MRNIESALRLIEDGFAGGVTTSKRVVEKRWKQVRVLQRALEEKYGTERFGRYDYPEAARVVLACRKLTFSGMMAKGDEEGARSFYEVNAENAVRERDDPNENQSGTAKAFVQWVDTQGLF